MALLVFSALQPGLAGYLPLELELAGSRVAVARPRVMATARMEEEKTFIFATEACRKNVFSRE